MPSAPHPSNPDPRKPRSDTRPIGVFDSGMGGLTVVDSIRKAFPAESIVYLGDTQRVPYGNRSAATVVRFALQDMDFLLAQRVKMIIAACNTVSAYAIPAMHRASNNLPLFDVIGPGAEAAIATGAKRILVLGTRGTIRSGAYARAVHALAPNVELEQLACPLLVPVIEEGILHGPLLEQVFDLYLKKEKRNPPDVILLGCTHYPLIRHAISAYFDGRVRVVDSADAIVRRLRIYFRDPALAADPGVTEGGSLRIHATDLAGSFHSQAKRFLEGTLPEIQLVELS